MSIQKKIPHIALLQKLLVSQKLTKAEHTAFIKIKTQKEKLSTHQELWIETLVKKYL